MAKQRRNTAVCVGVGLRRTQLGWTQAQLANRSGYSLRVIGKAEMGAPILRSTAEDIAEALQIEVNKIIFDPAGVAEAFVDAMHGPPQDFLDQIPKFFHADCVVNMAGPEEIPFSGIYHGVKGALKCFEIFYSILETPDHDHRPYYEYFGYDDFALAHGETWTKPKGVTIDKPVKLSLKFKFKDGKIIRFDDIFDTDLAKKAICSEPEKPTTNPET